MTTNKMIEEIFENLKAEIYADVPQADLFNETLLRSKVEGAFREVKAARRYPSSYSPQRIESDMVNFYSNIQNLARDDYNAVGGEGLSSYSADGASIHYRDRNRNFAGVYPIAR